MYSSIKRLYKKTGNKNIVEKAYKKGWITKEQKEYILSLEVTPAEETSEEPAPKKAK